MGQALACQSGDADLIIAIQAAGSRWPRPSHARWVASHADRELAFEELSPEQQGNVLADQAARAAAADHPPAIRLLAELGAARTCAYRRLVWAVQRHLVSVLLGEAACDPDGDTVASGQAVPEPGQVPRAIGPPAYPPPGSGRRLQPLHAVQEGPGLPLLHGLALCLMQLEVRAEPGDSLSACELLALFLRLPLPPVRLMTLALAPAMEGLLSA